MVRIRFSILQRSFRVRDHVCHSMARCLQEPGFFYLNFAFIFAVALVMRPLPAPRRCIAIGDSFDVSPRASERPFCAIYFEAHRSRPTARRETLVTPPIGDL